MCGTVTNLSSAIDANGLRLGDLLDSPLALHLTVETDGEFTLCVISNSSGTSSGGMYTTGILHKEP